MALTLPKSPRLKRATNSVLSRKSSTSQSTRFLNLSARVRLSTAITRCSPRSLSALTMLLPINPAAPVTMIVMMVLAERSGEKFVVVDGRRTQLPDDDSRCTVGVSNAVHQRHTRAQHGCNGCNDRVASTRNIIHFACIGLRVDHPVGGKERHALFRSRQQQRAEI